MGLETFKVALCGADTLQVISNSTPPTLHDCSISTSNRTIFYPLPFIHHLLLYKIYNNTNNTMLAYVVFESRLNV